MFSILVLLAARTSGEKLTQSAIGWVIILLICVYLFKKEEPENERRRKQPKKKERIVKSWVYTVFFSLIMLTSFSAIFSSFQKGKLSLFSFIVLFTIFYSSAVGVRKLTNFRLLFRKKSVAVKNHVAERS
ncbi:hypothetical protein [Candidatus Uabimicrobium sp. HlEnr_7]|uniref:hypothetical protein n=1 Tax=Candidatus Uabimicrobium helgolandensis TaxID=3095367 RepID=UPI00355637FB